MGGGSGSGSSGSESTTHRVELPGDLDVESMLFSPATGLQAVYFDYNQYDLRQDALDTLRMNAEKIKAAPGVVIQIEGHCDERGTQEYNLALGEKRALATRSHLINLGVSGDRLITISYGEEDPADSGHTESAWAKNRRCQFNRAM
ncbi:MAG: peptidoglycan-associated lipoprotein Pal [Candidatus Hydrogenedentes bacterium]|nr:peptidoglycan-associated lipoprotein Pal [Candidatus Hydrogenedentota bacterium]